MPGSTGYRVRRASRPVAVFKLPTAARVLPVGSCSPGFISRVEPMRRALGDRAGPELTVGDREEILQPADKVLWRKIFGTAEAT